MDTDHQHRHRTPHPGPDTPGCSAVCTSTGVHMDCRETQIRADERAKVVDQVAEALQQCYLDNSDLPLERRLGIEDAFYAVRALSGMEAVTFPSAVPAPTCRHPVEPGSDICIRTFSDPPCPACPDFGEDTP